MSVDRTIRIGVVRDPLMAEPCALDDTRPRRCPMPGVAIEAAKLTCEYLKLSCTFEWASDPEDYGRLVDGRWTGLTGDLVSGKFDASIPNLFPTIQRQNAVDFSSTYFYLDHVFVTRQPDDRAPPLDFGMLFAFSWKLWFGLFLCCFALALTISLLEIGHVRLAGYACFKVCQYLGGRDHSHRPFGKIRSNVLYTLWGVTSVVLYGTYTGTMFSTRLSRVVEPPFDDLYTFIECIELGRCRFIATPWQDYLKDRLYSAMQSDPSTMEKSSVLFDNIHFVESSSKVWEKILNDRETYWTTIELRTVFNAGTNYNRGNRFYALEAPFKDIASFAVPKRSEGSLLRRLNDGSKLFSDHGLSAALMRKYTNQYSEQHTWTKQQPGPGSFVTIYSVRSFFIFYFAGVLGALVLFGLERLHYELKRMGILVVAITLRD